MDTRIEPLPALGLRPGDAKILRNAGGRVTPDVLRSLWLATRLLGVHHVLVMHHTGCAMAGTTDAELRERLTSAAGAPAAPGPRGASRRRRGRCRRRVGRSAVARDARPRRCAGGRRGSGANLRATARRHDRRGLALRRVARRRGAHRAGGRISTPAPWRGSGARSRRRTSPGRASSPSTGRRSCACRASSRRARHHGPLPTTLRPAESLTTLSSDASVSASAFRCNWCGPVPHRAVCITIRRRWVGATGGCTWPVTSSSARPRRGRTFRRRRCGKLPTVVGTRREHDVTWLLSVDTGRQLSLHDEC